jgi:ribosomal protein S18 acetylase RimI-like enzyme
MVRPLSQEDLEGLAELMRWMDGEPSRGILAPEGRTPEELALELSGSRAWVAEEEGRILGYVALEPFWEGGLLEGPILQKPIPELLEPPLQLARRERLFPLYAFPFEANRDVRRLLEEQGFAPQHTTYFFGIDPHTVEASTLPGLELKDELDPEVYREVYRACEDWSLRLSWSDEELLEHFAEGAYLWLAYERGQPVGLIELEPFGEGYEIAYVGVIPQARKRGIGRALIAQAAQKARALGARLLRVRAHDHEKEAQALFRRLGFAELESVVTYTRD